VYLAVTFAASGHDLQAASAFQTSLVDGSDLPQIYEWLGDTLMRTHDLSSARSVLEEAVGKWPADIRFSRPLAMLYATFGRGREAVRTLERYLAERPSDKEALYLGVEWLYNVHAAGGLVHTRAQDLKLAHTYADAYEKEGGPQAALVKQWTDFLDHEK
jgi:tetratricopeptide (TPR) repeat protein